MEVCICVLPAFLHGVRKAGEWSLGTRLPDPHTPGVGDSTPILSMGGCCAMSLYAHICRNTYMCTHYSTTENTSFHDLHAVACREDTKRVPCKVDEKTSEEPSCRG